MRKGSLPDTESLDARGLTFAVVAARWNADVTDRLLDGALSAFREARARDVSVVRVPGSFELVSACRWEVRRSRSAVVSIGCLIRGDTPHFDVLSRSVASALAHLNAEQDVPIAFGVLTCDDRAQALARAGGRGGNAGTEAARAAIQMARLRPGRSSARSRAGAR
jgi:6,7-dimethyl-8-ribityllumazine synthase